MTVIIIVAGMLGIALLVVLVLGYMFNWEWTGLGPYIPPTKDSNFQRGETLWDWLNLLGVLAIPAVVGLGAAWYTTQQGKVSDRENTDNQRETALQKYIDKMSELLLEKQLREPPEAEVRIIARVRTITILSQLDARRIGYVFTFLREAGLMSTTSNSSVVSLKDADLRTVQWGRADLFRADLRGANLSGADLSKADLRGANLESVKNITTEELEKQANSLKGATMPDGSIHP